VAFIYELSALDNSTWALTNTIPSPSGANSGFGTTVKIDGDFLMIATYNNNGSFHFCSTHFLGKINPILCLQCTCTRDNQQESTYSRRPSPSQVVW
jgi:hypothetical protein